ncbi:transglycosylase domain-containing protein [Rubellimicrobium aerolatum]|uniref:peptidoglycan glycosyltransferase n=1 Tax=Rubellimicrobium aerolatum TaxID=490979 RepID=A0ABW0SBG2_9RHOB|nr:transglycosylase domain-containing protein [Rubellimicrobium aerolatum]MBP1805458.1 membrane peptidoglycan carboxypeptidase [Rubellimicrobium aerolatum]
MAPDDPPPGPPDLSRLQAALARAATGRREEAGSPVEGGGEAGAHSTSALIRRLREDEARRAAERAAREVARSGAAETGDGPAREVSGRAEVSPMRRALEAAARRPAEAPPLGIGPAEAAPAPEPEPPPEPPPAPPPEIPGPAAAEAPAAPPDWPVIEEPAREGRPRAGALRRAGRWLAGGLLLMAAGAAGMLLLLGALLGDLPVAPIEPAGVPPTLAVRTAGGLPVVAQGPRRGTAVALAGMPPVLTEAVLAVEDRRFRAHGGIDPRAILRAALRNLWAGEVVEGGSTITQQVAKTLYLGPERTLARKLQEAVLAVLLERQVGKDRVLELYLNSVYLGAGAWGMPAAAQTYFGKDLGALTLPEAALLAASIRAPSAVNPLADLPAARERAALVLRLMEEQGRIDGETRAVALAALEGLGPVARVGGHYADWLARELRGLAAPGGWAAVATIDAGLQAEAERAVREVLAAGGVAAGASEAAVVAMTPDGRVRAMVGGVDHRASQFNRAADARRAPGPAFLLVPYLGTLVEGAGPGDPVSDAPMEIPGLPPGAELGAGHGEATLREAFAGRYGYAAARVGQRVGLGEVVAVARRLGIGGDLPDVPALPLGMAGVSLLDLTEAYAAVALGRAPVRATGIEALAGGGGALAVSGAEEREATTLARTQAPMLGLLRAAAAARGAAVPGLEVAGQGGLSPEGSDAWFVGIAGEIVVGVWVGNDDDRALAREAAEPLPVAIFARVAGAATR